MFDELQHTKKMDEPKPREAEDLKRSGKELKKYKKRKTSVSIKTMNVSLFILSALATVAIAVGVIYAIYYVFSLYMYGV